MSRSVISNTSRRAWFKALHLAKLHGKGYVTGKHSEVVFAFDGQRISWYHNGQQVSESVAKSKVRGICYGKLKDKEKVNDQVS